MSPVEQIGGQRPPRLRYQTTEHCQFGPLILHNRIAVETTLTAPDERIDTLVRSFPRITLAVVYLLRPTQCSTEVAEQMTVASASLLMPFVVSQAERAQR